MHETTSLINLYCDHAKHIRGCTKITLTTYRNSLHYCLGNMGVSKISEITPANLEARFIELRVTRNWKASTLKAYQQTIKIFFHWCMARKYIIENPCALLTTPRIPKIIPPRFTKDEAEYLLAACLNYPFVDDFRRYRNYAILATFLYAGLRKGELINLHLMDIDMEAKTIHIRKGKGLKDRLIPMSHELSIILARYLVERRKTHRVCPSFFASMPRNVGITEAVLKDILLRLNSVTKFKFTVHTLRHTFATLMLEGGCDLYSLSKLLGHSKITTTMIYLSATTVHLQAQITKHPLEQPNRYLLLNNAT